ncbi:MAG: aquaporin [bacterium]|nr:aquaporin [bacterium]
MMKKYIAEMAGTFVLTFAVALSLGGKLAFATPLMASIVVGILVYVMGHISGTHINPAITVGLWSWKKIGTKDALFYVLFQFVGAIIACFASGALTTVPALIVLDNWPVFLGELIGTFVLAFGVAAVVAEKVHPAASGLVIGGSLFLGISFASFLSNGVLNPAVAMGINSFSLAYLVGPLLGGILGMQAFVMLSSRK